MAYGVDAYGRPSTESEPQYGTNQPERPQRQCGAGQQLVNGQCQGAQPQGQPAPGPQQPSTYTAETPTDQGKFAGYNFGGHQGQQFEYSNPAEGAKYAVSNYLNGVNPNTANWGEQAAADLNKQFGTTDLFKSVTGPDGSSRLSYGDEAVSSGGDSGGGNKGQFTWTSSGPGGGGAPGGGPGGAPGPGGMASWGSVLQPYTPGALPQEQLPVYHPGDISQFTSPDQGDLQDRTKALISNMLGSPTYSDDTINQMKETQKETAMKAMSDQLGANASQYARLGRSDSGQAEGADRDARANMISSVLGGNRDIDINTTAENRASRERAAGISSGFMNDTLNRATQGYSTGLQGQLAREQVKQAGVQSDADRVRQNLQTALAGEGLKQTAAGLGLQGNQQTLQAQQAAADLAERSRQFNSNMNFNYGQSAQDYNKFLIQQALGYQ